MKLTSARRGRNKNARGVSGPARLDRRTTSLVKRLRPGDIAIIDHVDLNRSAAVSLVEAKVSAVVNLAPSVSGRYPNLGPDVLLDAGIPLVDNVDRQLFSMISDGDVVTVVGDGVYRGEELLASGVVQDRASVESSRRAASDGIGDQLEAFAANAIAHLGRERKMLIDGDGVPSTTTRIRGRYVVVVSKAFAYQEDLRALRRFIREVDPILVGVDAGADVLLRSGHRPDIVVTNLDDISDRALRAAGEVVVHSPSSTVVRGLDRLDRLNLRYTLFVSGCSDEDAAIVLANTHEARLIVTVGSHSSLVEFFDRGRSAMASSFMTRSTASARLVDARAVGQLYRHRVPAFIMLLAILVGVALVCAAIATTPVGQQWWTHIHEWIIQGYHWVRAKL